MMLGMIFESFGKAFEQMVFESTALTQRIGLLGIVIFILVEGGMAILRFFQGSGESFPNFQKTLSYVVLFFFLMGYVPVMRLFNRSVNSIERYLRTKGETNYNTLAMDLLLLKNIQHAPVLVKAADDAGALEEARVAMANTWEEAMTTFRSTIDYFTFSVPALIFASVADGLTGIIRYLVEMLAILLTGVLIIVGPLAAMFQTAPYIGEGILKNWFSTWLSVKCWSITMSIIDMMMHKFLVLFTSQDHSVTQFFSEDMGGTTIWLQVVNLCFIILFICTPLITSYYIKGSGGAFLSKVVGSATTLIHSAVGVSTLGSSMAAGKIFKETMGNIGDKLDSISKKLNSK